MEDDLVKQHKNKEKRIKSSEKQQNLPKETKDTVNTIPSPQKIY